PIPQGVQRIRLLNPGHRLRPPFRIEITLFHLPLDEGSDLFHRLFGHFRQGVVQHHLKSGNRRLVSDSPTHHSRADHADPLNIAHVTSSFHCWRQSSTRSTTVAIPCPTPMHIVTSP